MYSENFNSFTGIGFAPNPSAGQLDSDIWSITGLSDGDLDFGGTGETGDFARGISTGGVSTGGVYAFEVETGNSILGIQPGGNDFTPGELILKVANDSGSTLTDIDLSYAIYFLNQQNRSNSLNLSYSEDGTNYTEINALDFATPGTSDNLGWQSEQLSTNISGLNLAPNESLYLKWTGDDVSGSGSRDEYGIDDVVVGSIDTANTAPTVANSIDDRNTIVDNQFNFIIPESTFEDADADGLTYSAALADADLPDWLNFATDTATFSGTPNSDDIGTITIEVTASDGKDTVSDSFNLLVADMVVNGGEGKGTSGNNGIIGSTGRDTIRGADGDDSVNGGEDRDQLYGDSGNDILNGGSGDDDLEGGIDNDTIDGGQGKDKLYGNAGNDSLSGGSNNDFLFGGIGDDLLDGGLGNDNLSGGDGIDSFVLRVGDGRNIIQDFTDETDLFAMADGLNYSDLDISLLGTHPTLGDITQIDSNSETLAIVLGVNPSNLTETADFTTI